MKKVFVITTAVMAMGLLKVKAQKVEFIPKAGINFAQQAIKDVKGEKSKIGITGGVGFNVHLAGGFSVQPEINYVTKGTKLKTPTGTQKLNLSYLEIPILAKYNFKGFYVNAGPSIGLLMGGKNKFTGFYGSEPRKIDVGLQMGAGLALPAGPGKVIIDGRYAMGFTDVTKGAGNVKNRGIYATVGYAIPL